MFCIIFKPIRIVCILWILLGLYYAYRHYTMLITDDNLTLIYYFSLSTKEFPKDRWQNKGKKWLDKISEPVYHHSSCPIQLWQCLRGSITFHGQLVRRGKIKGYNSISKIDIVSRVLFPTMFLLFLGTYWYFYAKMDYWKENIVFDYD